MSTNIGTAEQNNEHEEMAQQPQVEIVHAATAARFTFFPDPREQAIIQETDIATLAEYFTEQSDMTARFVHELWRNHRYNEIMQLSAQGCITKIFPPYSGEDAVQFAQFMHDMTTSSAMMICWEDVTPEHFFQFCCEVTILIALGQKGVSSASELDPTEIQAIVSYLKMTCAIIQQGINRVVEIDPHGLVKQELELLGLK